MKKLIQLMISCLMVFSLIGICPGLMTIVQAKEEYNYYPLACSAYSAAKLNKDGTFTEVLCTSDYNAARKAMNELGDAGVIRNNASYSPTKIIEMVSGVVYSYPQRSGSNTATIEQFYENEAPQNNKTTYVTVHREMRYRGTYSYDKGTGNGKVRITLTGFDGYIDLKNCDLVPMVAITEGIPLYLGGNSTYDGEQPFLTYAKQAFYRVEQNGNYRDLVYYYYSGYGNPDNGGQPQAWVSVVGPAADWMETGKTYFSDDSYTFYYDRYFKSQAGIYYNYYQFMPLRTQSKISASTMNGYIDSKVGSRSSVMRGTGQSFAESGITYGMNSLLVFSIGCLESGYGTSSIAMRKNNLFGIAAFDSDPNQATAFDSVNDCIVQEMGYFLRGFVDINDWRFFGSHLGNKGSGVNVKYAADPYWGMKIAAIAYDVDKANNGYNGQLTDFNTQSFAVITSDERINILKTPGGKTLYNSAYGATYQKNHIVAVLEDTGDYYKIQSTSYMSDGSVMSVKNVGPIAYNWNNYIGYVKKDQVTILNAAVVLKNEVQIEEPTQTLDQVSLDKQAILTLKGKAYVGGVNITSDNTLTGKLIIKDTKLQNVREIASDVKVSGDDHASWQVKIDLKDLNSGEYLFDYSYDYSNAEYDNTYVLNRIESLPEDIILNGRDYRFDRDGTLLKVTITEVNCGTGASYDSEKNACICNKGYENLTETGCSVIPEKAVKVRTSVDKIEKISEQQFKVSGLGFIQGINATADSNISYEIQLIDLETETIRYRFDAAAVNRSKPLPFGDSYDYTRIMYEGIIDLKDVVLGNYYIVLEITNGEEVYSGTLHPSLDAVNSIYSEDHIVTRVYVNQMFNSRFEVSIEAQTLDLSVINLPTEYNSLFSQNSLKFDENGVLKMDGIAFIYGIPASLEQALTLKLIIEDELGRTTSFDLSSKACKVDPAKLRKWDYSLSQSCFAVSMDLSDISAGNYRMYLDITNGEYRDIFEVYNLSDIELPSFEDNNHIYTIEKTSIRNRYILKIKDKE